MKKISKLIPILVLIMDIIPYSAITIQSNCIIVGGSEPPAHGLLQGYQVSADYPDELLINHFEIGDIVENNELQV
ncbi:TPA: hypothetical protein U1079_001182, partial [Streptococcus suis]|nr:hypothetical protein [Streptococcus suis]